MGIGTRRLHKRDTVLAQRPAGKIKKTEVRAAHRAMSDDADAKVRAAVRTAAGHLLDEAAALITQDPRDRRHHGARQPGGSHREAAEALIAGVGGNRSAAQKALTAMLKEYTTAGRIGRGRQTPDLYYPEFNRLVAEVALKAGRSGWRTPDRAVVENVTSILARRIRMPTSSAWQGQVELAQMLAVTDGSFAAKAASLRKDFEELHLAVPSHRRWGSVYDTALLLLERYRPHLGTAKQRNEVDTTLALLRGYAHP